MTTLSTGIGLLMALISTSLISYSLSGHSPPTGKRSATILYAFDSNGGYYGYIKTPDGRRMADQFGILDNGTEAWCGEFAWQKDRVVCKLNETYVKDGKKINTKNGV